FHATVQDTTPPSIIVPADITTQATGPSGAVVTYTATATDLVDGTDPVSCSPASGSTFPLGQTTVNCSSTDAHSNTSSASFHVIVQDTTPPTITVPADFSVEATGPSGAVVTYTATATDLVDGTDPVSCSRASGSTFPLGQTTVNCSSTDAHSNTSSASFHVIVQDTTPPTITVPADFSVEATGPSGAVVTYTATATDLVDGTDPVSCSPASGSTFPLGQTTVNCSSTDAHNNTSNASFHVTVQDTTAPNLTVPADFAVEATGPGGAIVTYSVSATDQVDPNPSVSCNPPSGTNFFVRVTPVTCTASDSSGNTVSKTFRVTVQDTTPPTLTAPGNISVETSDSSGAVVTYSAKATDSVDP